jgi:hypothetical protein
VSGRVVIYCAGKRTYAVRTIQGFWRCAKCYRRVKVVT